MELYNPRKELTLSRLRDRGSYTPSTPSSSNPSESSPSTTDTASPTGNKSAYSQSKDDFIRLSRMLRQENGDIGKLISQMSGIETGMEESIIKLAGTIIGDANEAHTRFNAPPDSQNKNYLHEMMKAALEGNTAAFDKAVTELFRDTEVSKAQGAENGGTGFISEIKNKAMEKAKDILNGNEGSFQELYNQIKGVKETFTQKSKDYELLKSLRDAAIGDGFSGSAMFEFAPQDAKEVIKTEDGRPMEIGFIAPDKQEVKITFNIDNVIKRKAALFLMESARKSGEMMAGIDLKETAKFSGENLEQRKLSAEGSLKKTESALDSNLEKAGISDVGIRKEIVTGIMQDIKFYSDKQAEKQSE